MPHSRFGSLPRARREMTGGASNPPFAHLPLGLNLETLEQHARGRLEAVAKVASGVALLAAEGRVSHMDHVSTTGAAYQDIRGTKRNPRAHRFPCNPKIGIWNLPEIVSVDYHQLRQALKEPLAITDLLPVEANHADSSFERNGGAATVEEIVRCILAEQKRGKAPNINLIRHAVSHMAVPGFAGAYEIALENVERQTDAQSRYTALGDPQWFERMNAESADVVYRDGRPTDNLPSVADVLHFYLRTADELPAHFDPLQISDYNRSLDTYLKVGEAIEKEKA